VVNLSHPVLVVSAVGLLVAFYDIHKRDNCYSILESRTSHIDFHGSKKRVITAAKLCYYLIAIVRVSIRYPDENVFVVRSNKKTRKNVLNYVC
jgi:hypothetical protein